MAKTERLQLRVSEEMKAQLERLAAADGRSVTNYIEQLVRREIERQVEPQARRSCRTCRRVCIDDNGNHTDYENGCEKWQSMPK